MPSVLGSVSAALFHVMKQILAEHRCVPGRCQEPGKGGRVGRGPARGLSSFAELEAVYEESGHWGQKLRVGRGEITCFGHSPPCRVVGVILGALTHLLGRLRCLQGSRPCFPLFLSSTPV